MKKYFCILKSVNWDFEKAKIIYRAVKDMNKCSANYICRNLNKLDLFGLTDMASAEYNDFIVILTCVFWDEYIVEYVINPVQNSIYESGDYYEFTVEGA